MSNLKDYEEVTDLFTDEGIKHLQREYKNAKPFDLVLAFQNNGKKTDYKVKVKGKRVYGKEIKMGDPERLRVVDVKEGER